jgi:hypothetical protein
MINRLLGLEELKKNRFDLYGSQSQQPVKRAKYDLEARKKLRKNER